jgi:hypothetical protein
MHRVKTNRNGLWAQIGGPFERAFFQLWIEGPCLDPAEIASTLGLEPTKSYRKGDPTKSGSQYRKTGLWLLESRVVRLGDRNRGHKQFERWLKGLPGNPATWRAIGARFSAKVAVVLYANAMNGEFLLTPLAVQELAKRRLGVMVDGYFISDED